jgi:hypothetical protein
MNDEIAGLPEHEQHENDCPSCRFGKYIDDPDPWWSCMLIIKGSLDTPPIYCHWQPNESEQGDE